MSQTFPATVPVKDIDAKHPELQKFASLYDDLRLLYVGGKELKDQCFRFLVKRQRELGTAFLAREAKINYDPILSTVVSFYVSKMYENGIEVEFANGESSAVDEFYTDFVQECDRGDTSLELFFTRLTEELLVYGKSYFIIDLPKLPVQPSNLNEQQQLGGLNPYLAHIDITAVQNWQQDAFGNFEWCVVHNKQQVQSFLANPLTVETWTYYDKTNYAVYQCEYAAEGKQRPTTAMLVDSGRHAMADQSVVPVIAISTSQHWLGNRLYLSLLEHFNAYNSLAFSLWQALNPVPVIQDGEQKAVELQQTVSEYAFLHLPYNGKAFWLEPQGTSWDASLKYLEELRSNVYRMAHVSPLGRSTKATPNAQSGYSKELEMSPSASVLNCIGTMVKNVLQQTLDAVAAIRGESVKSDVRGFTFVQDTAASTIDIALAAKALTIHSTTALRELEKQVVRSLFRNDANADLVQQMVDEIEATPDEAFHPPQSTPGAPGGGADVTLNISERAGNPQ
ncbi:MAG TPA: hypothetical protein VN736_01125 [Candidatus Limnocylindrales bacterium]|nr:hypothetical protein [Candidatus Limnocylindrales bacterium]